MLLLSGKAPKAGIPVFTCPLADVTATTGSSSTLQCRIRGHPRPVVLWQKDHDFLRSGSKHRCSFDGDYAMLEILRVEASDAGSYTCVTRNEFGKVRSGCVLTVKGNNFNYI